MATAAGIKAGKAFIYIEALDKTGFILKRIGTRLRKWAGGIQSLGQGLVTKSLAAMIPAAFSVKAFADFEHMMAFISTMLEEPEKHMDSFRKGIRQLARETGKDTADIGKGLYDILSAQVPPEKALDLLRESSRLAVSGNAEVADSVKVMITLMETYGDRLKGAGDGADFLMACVKRGRTTLGELAPELGRVIALSRESGLSLEDMGASIALMTRATGQTDLALTALQNTAKEFIKPSKEGAELWKKKYGEAFDTTTLKAIGFMGVLKRLHSMTIEEVGIMFPNIRAERGLLPAIRKIKDFNVDLATMRNRTGEAGVAFEKMSKSPRLALDKLWQGVKDINRSIGKALVTALEGAFGPLEDVITACVTWIEANQAVVTTLAAVAAGVGVLGIGLLGLSAILKAVALGFTLVGVTLIAVKILFVAITSPIGLFVAAIAGAIALLYRFSDSFHKLGNSIGSKLVAKFVNLRDTIKSTFAGLSLALSQGDMQAAWEILTMGMEIVWLELVDGLKDIWAGFEDFFRGVVDALKEVWGGFIHAVENVPEFLLGTAGAKGLRTMLEQGRPLSEAATSLSRGYRRARGEPAGLTRIPIDPAKAERERVLAEKRAALQARIDALGQKERDKRKSTLEALGQSLKGGFLATAEGAKGRLADLLRQASKGQLKGPEAIAPKLLEARFKGTIEAAQQAQENLYRDKTQDKQLEAQQEQITWLKRIADAIDKVSIEGV